MTSFAFCVRFVWTRGYAADPSDRRQSVPIYRSTRLSAFRISRRQRRLLRAFHLPAPALLPVSLISFIDAISEMSFSLTAINLDWDKEEESRTKTDNRHFSLTES